MNEPVDERPLEGHLAPADVVGGEAAGWKAALGGERARALGLRGPLVGRLVTDRVFESGATISVSGWASARVEPETAVRLGRDVPPDADEQAIWDCVAAVLPAFELVDVTAGFDDVEAMLRTNIYHRAVVVGAPADPPSSPRDRSHCYWSKTARSSRSPRTPTRRWAASGTSSPISRTCSRTGARYCAPVSC